MWTLCSSPTRTGIISTSPHWRSSVESVRVVLPRGAGRIVRRLRFANVVEVDVGQSVEIGDVTVTATEAEHDAGRGPFGVRAPALGYLVTGSKRIYFAGDTDLFPAMAELAPLDLALLPVAGWGPRLAAGSSRRAAGHRGAAPARAAIGGADPLGNLLTDHEAETDPDWCAGTGG